MIWNNQLTEILKIDYPIVQAPMLGVTTVEMVATISNLGGLGSLPVGGLSPDKTLELIHQTKALTNRPFAVNFFANDIPVMNNEEIMAMTVFLQQLFLKNNLDALVPSPDTFNFYSYTDQVQLLLKENISIVSFTFGIPGKEIIKLFRDNGVTLIGTATSLKEAKILAENQIDIITAQGIEAGGHRGSFLKDEPLPMVGSISLIPQIANNINKPVIAAGGINDGRTMKAAMILGAKGVQVGTAFIASDESMAIPSYKQAIKNAAETDSVLTNAFTGRWARGIRNTFISEFENTSIKIPQYPIQNGLIAAMRMAALQRDDKEFANLWAGQSSSSAKSKPAGEIFKGLIESMEALQ